MIILSMRGLTDLCRHAHGCGWACFHENQHACSAPAAAAADDDVLLLLYSAAEHQMCVNSCSMVATIVTLPKGVDVRKGPAVGVSRAKWGQPNPALQTPSTLSITGYCTRVCTLSCWWLAENLRGRSTFLSVYSSLGGNLGASRGSLHLFSPFVACYSSTAPHVSLGGKERGSPVVCQSIAGMR